MIRAGSRHGAETVDGPGDSALIELRGAHRTYRMGDQVVRALDGVDLAIAAGEFVAIVGQSGSGKSTLLNLLGCLDRPSLGHYRIDGRDTAGIDPDGLAALRRHSFGFVFQSHNLLPRLSAVANVALPAVFAGEAPAERRRRATALLTGLGLGERLDHRPAQLSGGQQQRVGIARALMNGGRIILADEPTGALDSRTSADLLGLLRGLCDEGHTVVIVTHDPQVAATADRVVEIADGRIRSDRRQRIRRDARPSLPRASGGTRRRTDQVRDAATSAAATLMAHRLRNLLTMLGIVIGIAAVILAVAIGQGAQQEVLARMRDLGNNLTEVMSQSAFLAGPAAQSGGLRQEDVERLAALPFVTGVSPDAQTSILLRHRGRGAYASVYGVAPAFFRLHQLPITSGRPLEEAAARGADVEIVIDAAVRAALFEPDQDPLGAVILIGTVPARVVGVARVADSSRYGRRPFAALSYAAFGQRISGQPSFASVTLQLAEDVDRDVALAAVEKLLSAWRGTPDVVLFDNETQRETILRARTVLGLVTISIAGIALVIASVGVMNMMLIAVTERTREIGLLMALGARRSDVMLHFFVEAFTLCALGGALGAALALGLGEAGQALGLPFSLVFGWRSVAAAILSAGLSGLVAGLVPARRAARIDPVEALAR
ncbi:ABC transporter related [Methylobacterium sp. 4-46]|uniref:MacB family efflux pump subunit n=1 Tax=unclassified Methylobacterium TaxID=2615210 RepID=UPI000152DA81|nr:MULTISPECIES: MacB family efflux pump subunit [Methylobacterium]ACA20865.1 ABC transporter related [Methylobacterium sp. 4-46]WFT80021.1 MacB family efflux pump subunit [Methylobacterium nodulans]